MPLIVCPLDDERRGENERERKKRVDRGEQEICHYVVLEFDAQGGILGISRNISFRAQLVMTVFTP